MPDLHFLKYLLLAFLLVNCNSSSQEPEPIKNNKLNKSWITEIIKKSDSSYTKPYYRSDFVTASYYINKGDATLTQVMKDSAGNINQVIVEKNKIRSFYAQFYRNGQIKANIPIGISGKFDGEARLYYPDGKIKSKGAYKDGFYIGPWFTYDEKGEKIMLEIYDSSGRLTKTEQY